MTYFTFSPPPLVARGTGGAGASLSICATAQASISRRCEVAHTLSRFPSLKSSSSTWRQEAEMAQEPGLALSLGILAMAVVVLAIMMWAAPPNPESASAAPIPPREIIYRPQHLNLY